MVNISATLLAMGVPVAKTTPPPPFMRWTCSTLRNMSKARCDDVCGSPAMLRDLCTILDASGFRESRHGESAHYVIERAFVEK